MLPHETEAAAEIRTRYAKEITEETALHEAVVRMMTADAWTITRPGGTKPFTIDIIRGLLTKACKTFRSIQLLNERGLYEDAEALLRVLLETTVAVLFILQRRARDKKTKTLTPTSHQRAETFFAYSVFQQVKMIKGWKKTPGLKRQVSVRTIRKAEKELAGVAAHLPAGTNYEKHWSGKNSFKDAVSALRADPLYAVLYRHTSAISHVSDVGLHFEPDAATGELVWQLAPRTSGFNGPSYVSRELLWMLAHRIDERLGLGFAASLAPHKVKKP